MKRFIITLLTLWLSTPCFAQQDFREETIYFLLTTRFFDGDTSNTRPSEWSSYGANSPSITDPQDVTWRGDFKGLIEKLDYIKDLGFTAIWITPIVQNRSPLDYHGYHAWDFTKVDPRLESPGATFQDLINAVHAKGMKIILDIVTNHAGRFGIKGRAEIKYNTDPTQPWYAPDNPNWEYDGLTPNPQDGKIWSRANVAKMPPPYNQNLAAFNWPSTESYVHTSDPNWYHHSGNGFAQGWDDTTNLYQRALAGDTPDLNTGSTVVRNYMFNAYKTFIDMGVDGFRWDTWKHMNKEDIFHLLDRWRAVKPDLFVVGEVAQKRHELHQVQEINPHWYTWRGAVNGSPSANVSVIDFYAEATFHNIFQDGGGFSGVQAAARYDHLYSDPSQLVTWLDNHDFGPNNDWNQRYSGSDENLAACMNFMFTWRGIPCVYYGTENRFKSGAYCDIHNEAGIRSSIDNTGRAYFGNQFANAPNHRIYKHIRKINAIRRAIPALQKGTWRWAGNAPWNGVGYWREWNDSKVAVGLAKDGSASFNFNSVPNGIYRDAVTGRTINVSNGNLQFTVTSGSAGIYVLNGVGMIGESGAGFFEPCVEGCVVPTSVQISPTSSNYFNPIQVSMTAAGGSGNLTIRYTLDGSTPSVNSPIYTAPFTVSTQTVVKAIAIDQNGRISQVQAQRYTFVQPPPQVALTPNGGNSYDPVTINMAASGGTAPYTIFYTVDGSVPTVNSFVYNNPFTISQPQTIRAIARDARGTLSAVVSRSYTFVIPAPTITATPESGNSMTYPISVALLAQSPRPPVRIYYTLDSTAPTLNSPLYTTPLSIGSDRRPVNIRAIAIDSLGQQSVIHNFRYTFDSIPDIWIYFKKPANWANTVKIHYWNLRPTGVYANTTWPGVNMTQHCGDWYKFRFSGVNFVNIVVNDGAGRQTADLNRTATGYYENAWLATIPNIPLEPTAAASPAGPHTASSAFTATISATACTGTPNIYYTLDGTTPTTSSRVAASPLSLNIAQTTTVKFFAIDSRGNQTAIQTHVYTIQTPQNAPPSVTVTPSGPQTAVGSLNVRASATDDSGISPKIYFTTDGSTPTTRSDSAVGFKDFTFRQTTTLKVFSIDQQGLASNIQTHVYTIQPTNVRDLDNPKIVLHQTMPNPTTGETTFKFDLTIAMPYELKIYDLLGKQVLHTEGVGRAGENRLTLNLQNFVSSIYLYELQTNFGKVTRKLVKQ